MDDVGGPDGGEGGRQRGQMIWAQQPTAVGEADPVTVEGHDVVVGHKPQHPVQRVLVSADGGGQLRHRQRLGGQALGDLQAGDRAQAVPQEPQVDHLGQGLPVSRRIGHVRSLLAATWHLETVGG
jgi:hypothetical protein